jgi:hypothetical protein
MKYEIFATFILHFSFFIEFCEAKFLGRAASRTKKAAALLKVLLLFLWLASGYSLHHLRSRFAPATVVPLLSLSLRALRSLRRSAAIFCCIRVRYRDRYFLYPNYLNLSIKALNYYSIDWKYLMLPYHHS